MQSAARRAAGCGAASWGLLAAEPSRMLGFLDDKARESLAEHFRRMAGDPAGRGWERCVRDNGVLRQ